MALVIALLTLRLLRVLRRQRVPAPEGTAAGPGLRALGTIAAVVIIAALVTGHIGLAAFVAERLVTAIIVFGAVYLLIALIDSLFDEVLTADQPGGRAVAGYFGMRPQTLELAGTVLSGALRLPCSGSAQATSSSVNSSPRGLMSSAWRWRASSRACRTGCRLFRKLKRKPRSPPLSSGR